MRELFHVCYWLAHTYARTDRPAPGLTFDPDKLPNPGRSPKQTAEQLQQLEAALRERDEKLAVVTAPRSTTSWRVCAQKSRPRGPRRPPSPIRTTSPRPRPATTSSIFCSRNPGGRSISRATGNSKSAACRTGAAWASSITRCGATTDNYELEEAVRDGFLVPPKGVSVPLKFQREGIKYDDLSEEDKDDWDALEWDEDGNAPDKVEAAAVNTWLFNKDTVDKVLAHLMTRGIKVAGGDRLGKTILFAKNQDHAEYIADRFNANYPHYAGHFARVITFKTEYAQS